MAVSANDFLKSAEQLLLSKTEISFRNAASRAYYAAYHRCLLVEGLDPVQGDNFGTHQRLIKSLQHSANLKIKSVGYRLGQCHSIRIIADYQPEKEFCEHQAQEAIGIARRIIEDLDKLG